MPVRSMVLALGLTLAAGMAAAQQAAPAVTYHVAFPNAVHHEAEITLIASGLPRGVPAELWMSRSSPGRYALHEFAKNVYGVTVTNGAGKALVATRPNPYSWQVAGHDGTVKVKYTLFGNLGDGTYAQIDETHAHLNIPATFMWVKGLDRRAIRVTFEPPAGSDWKVASQLFPTSDPFTFTAPGLQYFMDSPTELSNYTLREWKVTVGGKTWPIRLALHHTGTEAEADSFAGLAKRVVEAHMTVYREAPRYDVGYYTFIADYLPWASGDGMEHRNSTIISSTTSLAKNMGGLLGTLSHEFFHSWNVERIRPRGLEPFDFTRANMSDALWFAEGFTNYYGPLAIARSGINSVEDFAHGWSGPVNFVVNSPARNFFSPAEMSMQAPFVDAAAAIDPNNRGNTFISYYTWGSVVGLGLDLTLRTRGHTLDELMRLMWQRYGKTEVSYTLADIEKALGDMTGDRAFAREFFTRYVRGREVVDYKALLANAGFLLRPAKPGAAFLGNVQLDYTTAGARITGSTQIGSPLYQAGLDVGDVITLIDGRPIESDSAFQALKAAHRPGDQLQVQYVSRGASHAATVVMAEDPRLEVVTYEEAGMSLPPEAKTFREKWLSLAHD
ncbi:MAG TPA: PDZ domain-containing protein [Gemmatimonadales bacterium]|nr:PDZ domain-containing protein [Gemmatimonadales bacterium]